MKSSSQGVQTRMEAERVFSVNGVDLSYSDVGDGLRTVLLIHGHPFNRTMWQPQLEFLKASYRVVVPDLRGYGTSS
jgi:3-oxoadipate enol-lactonase